MWSGTINFLEKISILETALVMILVKIPRLVFQKLSLRFHQLKKFLRLFLGQKNSVEPVNYRVVLIRGSFLLSFDVGRAGVKTVKKLRLNFDRFLF